MDLMARSEREEGFLLEIPELYKRMEVILLMVLFVVVVRVSQRRGYVSETSFGL